MRDLDVLDRIARTEHTAGYAAPVVARDFSDLMEVARARRTLARLAARGHLHEIVSGVWRTPASAPPDPADVATAIARRLGWRLTIAMAHAAQALGLSSATHHPSWAVDRSGLGERIYTWPGGCCRFEPAPAWVFDLATPDARRIAQALRWACQDLPTSSPHPRHGRASALNQIRRQLDDKTIAVIHRDRARFPTECRPLIDRITDRTLVVS
mgnify:CR=1 FL=1